MMTQNNDGPKKITNKDKKWIDGYVKEHFKGNVVFNYNERSLLLYNNDVLTDVKFLNLLTKFKFNIIPSLF